MTRLPLCRARDLATENPAHRWLVDALWSERAVGILGGEPKCGKSMLALEIAVAVASGAPCLRRFAVERPGRVLLFAAEDAPGIVRRRLDGICHAAQLALASLNLYLITAPVLRLALASDQERLEETVKAARPRLLVLDPFVRLHRIDENAAGEVAAVLSCLRRLERTCHSAVLLVHHVRKGAGHLRAGQALRGSSELHAWGDSNLYLRRRGNRLRLSVEHRAAAAPDDLFLRLPVDDEHLRLEVVDADTDTPVDAAAPTAHHRIYTALADAATPLTLHQLRTDIRMRTATLCDTLNALVAEGSIRKGPDGYSLVR
jgi:hypothetical protein